LHPELILLEVTNAVWKYYEFEKLELEACQHMLEVSVSSVDLLIPSKELYRDAFLMAPQLTFPDPRDLTGPARESC